MLDEVVRRHHERLRDGTYSKTLDHLEKAHLLHAKSVKALKEAMDLDYNFFTYLSSIDKEELKSIPEASIGPYAFLLNFLVEADITHGQSGAFSDRLDKEPVFVRGSIMDPMDASQNDASAEN